MLIRAGVIAVLVMFCFQIFSPFLDLMLWSVILAITLYPLQVRFKGKLGNKDGLTATLIVLIAISILMVPVYLLGASLAESVEKVMTMVKTDSFHIPPPSDTVASWPLVGKPLYNLWAQATTDLPDLAQKFIPQIKGVSLSLLSKLAGVSMGLLFIHRRTDYCRYFFSVWRRRPPQRGANRFALQRSDQRAKKIADLCTATIRAVALGGWSVSRSSRCCWWVSVFVFMGVPGAGLLALAVLLLGIMQLPASLITLPVIVFVFHERRCQYGDHHICHLCLHRGIGR
ncbi:AI-2E family transporter [Pseudomonas lini]